MAVGGLLAIHFGCRDIMVWSNVRRVGVGGNISLELKIDSLGRLGNASDI